MTLLHIDSRYRTRSSSASHADFNMIRVPRMSRFRVKSFNFYNTLHNISDHNNTLVTSRGTITIPPGFYDVTSFMVLLDVQLMNVFGNVGPHIELDRTTNTLTWSLGTESIDGAASTISDVLNLDKNSAALSGDFTSILHLSVPANISLSSPQLNVGEHNFHAGQDASTHTSIQPFLTAPISVPYLIQQVYDQTEPYVIFDAPLNISRLTIKVFNPATGNEYHNLTHWNLILEFY